MSGTINRRSFLKMMGWGGVGTALSGCDLPTTVTLEEGEEEVVSYLMPEEYVIPGVGVWYASVCTQCAANCGTHGRVREGRVLKLEGNPDSTINNSKLCMMGQAGVQGHYNPDRINTPMLRKNGNLVSASWDEAMAAIAQKVNSGSGDKAAWFTGTLSGHQLALLNNHLEAVGSNKHYSHEVINTAVSQAVNTDMFGESMPRYRMDKAKMILSFGADFLGAWMSPIHFAGEYAKFRTQTQRGLLVQIEPKMTLTGGSADLWIPSLPATEGLIALGIANALITTNGVDASGLPKSVQDLIQQNTVDSVAKSTGISAERIKKIASLLKQRSPSLVIAGMPVEGQSNGYNSVAAIMMLNHLLGNVGQTIESSGDIPFEQLKSKQGNTKELLAFIEDAKAKKLDAVFFAGSNPMYSAPDALAIGEALKNIPLKVAISQFPDETTVLADVVLPMSSYLEDWGTHLAAYQPEQQVLGMQQPLMEKLNKETKGFGDILLGLLQQVKKDEYGQYQDYYAYLRHAFSSMPANFKGDADTDEQAWSKALQKGVVSISAESKSLNNTVAEFASPTPAEASGSGQFYLMPSPRLGLWDGRHANLPWLQEAPDQISKIVWDSWVEMHPKTADKLGIKAGNIVKVKSENGEVTLKAILIKSIHPDVLSIPLGQGHTEYGRYAKGLGVNPLKIISPTIESKTGELAMFATRVDVSKTNKMDVIVKLGSSDTQMGRKFVVTVPVEQVRRTEGA